MSATNQSPSVMEQEKIWYDGKQLRRVFACIYASPHLQSSSPSSSSCSPCPQVWYDDDFCPRRKLFADEELSAPPNSFSESPVTPHTVPSPPVMSTKPSRDFSSLLMETPLVFDKCEPRKLSFESDDDECTEPLERNLFLNYIESPEASRPRVRRLRSPIRGNSFDIIEYPLIKKSPCVIESFFSKLNNFKEKIMKDSDDNSFFCL